MDLLFDQGRDIAVVDLLLLVSQFFEGNEQLLHLWDSTHKTICFVTHSIPEAVYLSTKIVVMSPRPGRITDVIESPLPRERPLDIRETPEFLEIAHRVRDGLRAGHGDDI